MELQKNTMRYQRQVARQTAYREETAESIVPDTLPDISRIVEAVGTAFIRDWELGTGEATVRCAVQVSVLYMAAEDQRLYHLEIPLAFTQRMELRGAEPGCGLLCSCSLVTADAHALNPRKVEVRVRTAVTPRLYAESEEVFTTGVTDGRECCFRTEKVSYAAVAAVSSKNFTLVEDVEVPDSEGTVRTVLSAELSIRPVDIRLMTNRVVVKAEAQVRALCENTEGRIFPLTYEFAFTQMADVSGAEEGQHAAVDFGLRSLDLDPALDMAGNSRYLSLSAGAVMNLELSRQSEMEVVTDLYGTRREASLTMRDVVLMDVPEEIRLRTAASDHADTAVGIRRVVDQRFQTDEAAEHLPGENTATLGVMVSVLYEGEDGGWYDLVRRLTLRLEAGQELPARVRTEILSFTVTAVPGGLDMELSAAVGAGEERLQCIPMVDAVSWGEEYPPDSRSRMSALIRRVTGKETLWEIAREYRTSVEAIALANQLAPDAAPAAGELLLIPMKK